MTQDLVVTEDDAARWKALMKAVVSGGEVIESLPRPHPGRTAAADVVHPETGKLVVSNGTLLTEDEVD